MSEPGKCRKRRKTVPEVALEPNTSPGLNAQTVWFSNATAGLIASLEAVGAKNKWVAVPPNVCPNVIAAVFGARCRPWFVDIEPECQGMDPARLSEVIGQVGAVIAIHAYGTPCKIEDIANVARQRGVPVVEDCAQADGACVADQEVGTFGDIAVFSFGKGKIVEAGGGGLAILRNERWSPPMEALIARWEHSSDSAPGDDLGNAYRFFYNQFYPDRTELARESFFAMVNALAPRFSTKCSPERIAELVAARSQRESLIIARRRKYQMYVEQLAGVPHIAPIPLQEGTAPWRFNAVVEANRRDAIFRGLLASDIRTSTWYPRITRFLPEQAFRSTELPVARHFEQTLLNLWVDDTTSVQDIERTCVSLKQELLRFGS